jgi:Kef-type K+ transport system membrane component KefB
MSELLLGLFTKIEVTAHVELALLLLVAAVLGVVFRILKQPLVLAYLITGILIGSLGLLNFNNGDIIEVFSSLGIMFLLFLVGMEMDYNAIKKTGKVSLAIGLGQVVFTALGGFLIAHYAFSFEILPALYIAVALTFSSTVIIIKLLSDKGSTTSLHGRAAVGLLLVQDLVVILILITLNAISLDTGFGPLQILSTVVIGVLLFILMLILGRNVFPYIFRKVAQSQELLFLISIAWLLVFAVIVKQFGFSIEIAGFLGGVALANSAEKHHIANKVRPLRDFFILIFFVYLGSLMVVSDFQGLLVPMIIFSLFVLIGNPLIVMTIMGIMRYKKRTGFLTGVTVAQISEFSLIFVTLGLALGHITNEVFALVVAIGVVTITLSTYIILYAEKIFPYIAGILSIFERKNSKEEEGDFGISRKIILIGANRIGRGIMSYIDKANLLVIDFDPIVADWLKQDNIDRIFADIKDPHLFEELNLEKTKLVVSTSPNFEDNIVLIQRIKEIDKTIKVIVRAESEEEAFLLYKKGTDYVLLPHLLSGKYLGRLIEASNDLEKIDEMRKKEIKLIESID